MVHRAVTLVLAAALAASVLLAVSMAPASAAYPGRDGRIAYNLRGNVWTVNPDGTGKRQLTTDGRSLNPRWSPDGRQIAFNRSLDLWVMNADGTHQRRVTSLHAAIQPTWSPDGAKLGFVFLQANHHGDIAWVPVSGGAVHRLTYDAATTNGDSRPTWSPKGGFILYQRGTQRGNEIRMVNVTTGQQRLITRDAVVDPEDAVLQPDFMPDGNHIIFLAYCDTLGSCYGNLNTPNVMMTGLWGGARTELTYSPGVEGSPIYSEMAAAPSGQGLVLVRGPCDNPWGGTCVITPGYVPHAVHPDWQPLPAR